MIKIKLSKQEVEALVNLFRLGVMDLNMMEKVSVGHAMVKEILDELAGGLERKLNNPEQKRFTWRLSRSQQLGFMVFAGGVDRVRFPYEGVLVGKVLEEIDRNN